MFRTFTLSLTTLLLTAAGSSAGVCPNGNYDWVSDYMNDPFHNYVIIGEVISVQTISQDIRSELDDYSVATHSVQFNVLQSFKGKPDKIMDVLYANYKDDGDSMSYDVGEIHLLGFHERSDGRNEMTSCLAIHLFSIREFYLFNLLGEDTESVLSQTYREWRESLKE